MMQKSIAVSALAAGAMAAGSCPSDTPLSCHNTTAVADTCCFIPTGQLLQTQFWDSSPPTGPSGTLPHPFMTKKLESNRLLPQ